MLAGLQPHFPGTTDSYYLELPDGFLSVGVFLVIERMLVVVFCLVGNALFFPPAL